MSAKMRCKLLVMFFFFVCAKIEAKSDEKSNISAEVKSTNKLIHSDGAALLFADELKQVIEKYMFGICPQPYKSRWSQMVGSKKNSTTPTCDLDADQQDLAGRLATLALRVHSVSRTDCTRFGAALANTFGELARTASNRQVLAAAVANEKKRKLSKSQKAKIAAKQRTALAVKKKAAAVAAAAAAKMATS
ncbi:uncharacterized protein LOC113393653 isoform X1 [Vanessa tameamea]|uniref:Uncharacterized protein LOC113393653 isoform X1 n=1 Tax=Vanessa tameamea TaxID=334116 RepID=A0A8B8HS56_VANTA